MATGTHATFVTLLAPHDPGPFHRDGRRVFVGRDEIVLGEATAGREARMTALAPDPAVPRRDALLRPETMAEVISQRLLDGVPVERCERVYVKYRVGDSLRAVYRYGDGEYVAVRTGRRAPAPAVSAPEVDAALWPFPHDRKLAALPALAPGSPVLSRLLGRPCTPRLVAYAAEQSASAACVNEHGRVLAFAKVGRDDAERRGCEALAGHDAVRVPRVLAAHDGVLLLEALEGRRLDHLDAPDLVPALHALGTALASLHALPAPTTPFTRLDPSRLTTAAAVITRVRPDVAPLADRVLTHLLAHVPDRDPVCLHGDANLRNAITRNATPVAKRGQSPLSDRCRAKGPVPLYLLDLEHVSAGPAAADLGQVLAGLVGARVPRREAAAALLAGYAEVATPPDRAALRWYTAASLLARVALPAVSRYRPQALARLREILEAAEAMA